MTIIIAGQSLGTKLEVDGNTLAARVCPWPTDWSPYPNAPGGTYSRKLTSVTNIQAGYNGSAWQFRWTNTAMLCAVRRISFSISGTSASNATITPFSLFHERFYTANGTGGTVFSGANHDGKRRDRQEPATVTDMRIAPSSPLGNGTWVQDTDPLSIAICTFVASPLQKAYEFPFAGAKLWPLWEVQPGEHPLILFALEGLNINLTASPASDNYLLAVRVEWDELPLV